MSKMDYDAIVVGARCGGAPTAMLLARQGWNVLLVDRASFPSDTVSTHIVQPVAAAALDRWGLLETLKASACPAIHTYSFQYSFEQGPFTLSGMPGTEASPYAYCPRRTVLDKMLVDAAMEAGVELREGFLVDDLLWDGGRVVGVKGHSRGAAAVREHARIVVGADGRHSAIAAAVNAQSYNERPPLAAAYYTYWSGLPMAGRFENYVRGDRGFGAVPTHDDLTLIIAGWPRSEFAANKSDVEYHYMRVIAQVPEFAERLKGAVRVEKFAGASVPNYFRKPFGAGWALVGDSAYNKDPITAQGMSDAFRDAELCAEAINQWLIGAASFEESLTKYQRDRDEQALGMYEMTCQLATLTAPTIETQRLLWSLKGNQEGMNAYVQMFAGTLSSKAFYAQFDLARGLRAAGEGMSAEHATVV